MKRAEALAEVLRHGLRIPRADFVEGPEPRRLDCLMVDVEPTEKCDVFRVQVVAGVEGDGHREEWNADRRIRHLEILRGAAPAVRDQEIYVQSDRATWEALKTFDMPREKLKWCGHPDQRACELFAEPFDLRDFDRSRYEFPTTLPVVPGAHASVDQFLVRRPPVGGLGAVRVKTAPPRLCCDPLVWVFVDEEVTVPPSGSPGTIWRWFRSGAGWQRPIPDSRRQNVKR